MDHRAPQQRPLLRSLIRDVTDRPLGHPRIVLEGQPDDLRARISSIRAHRAGEAADAADIGAAGGQRSDLRAYVEILGLNLDMSHEPKAYPPAGCLSWPRLI